METGQKKQKIVIVTPLGAEPRFDNYAEFILSQGLIAQGYEVLLHTYSLKNNPQYVDQIYKGVQTVRCRQRFGFSPKLFFSIISFRPDVVMLFHPRSFLNFSAYVAGRLVGAKIVAEIVGILHDPFVVSDRDDPIPNIHKNVELFTKWSDLLKVPFSNRPIWQWKNFIFHMPTGNADMIISINEDERKYVKQFYGRDSEVIYWCIRSTDTVIDQKPSEEKYGKLPESYLFFIGQLKRRKGWDTVLEAIAGLKKSGVHKNLIFVTSDIEATKVFVKKYELEDRVFLLSRISNEEKEWLYTHAEYVLAPSRYEGFGLPIFEAFKAHRPVLATDVPVLLEFLDHKKNAMISKIGDPEGLANSIRELDADPELVRKLIHEGDATAEAFSEKIMLEQYFQLLDRLR